MLSSSKTAARPVAPGCIFCKILEGELPCARVYEDNEVLAFLDINPIAGGHTLVVPKGHYPTLLELPESAGAGILRVLKLVAAALQRETGATGFNCIQNNFSSAGQMVFHAHWHVIPRFDADGLPDWPAGAYSGQEEMQALAQSLAARIAGV